MFSLKFFNRGPFHWTFIEELEFFHYFSLSILSTESTQKLRNFNQLVLQKIQYDYHNLLFVSYRVSKLDFYRGTVILLYFSLSILILETIFPTVAFITGISILDDANPIEF